MIKKIGSIVLLFTFVTLSPAEKPWYETFISTHPVACCIIGAATAFTIGASLYNYYQIRATHYEQFIENCRVIYKNIYKEIHYYHQFYRSDVQISDWDLKEMIIDSYKELYPFMAYYQALIKSSWHLHSYLTTLNQQLATIKKYKKQLVTSRNPESTANIQEMLKQLEITGKQLQEFTMETITLITILKNRLNLFREYNDDCYNWSQTVQKTKSIMI